MHSRRSHAPLVFALLVLAIAIGGSIRASLLLTGGRLVYALDDAYIHMAMARTLAESGVWGIAPAHPAFASSSPGWTVLLAVLYRAGLSSEWVPLLLNIIAAATIIVIADSAARRLLATDRARLWLLVTLVFVAPAPALVLGGMETLWQIAAVLGFVSIAARFNTMSDARWRPLDRILLPASAAAMVAFRYESLFVAAACVLVLCWRRRLALAVVVAASAVVPVATYAIFSMAHGGWWLPASVMLKGQPPTMSLSGVAGFLADKGFPAILSQPPLPPLLLALLVILLVLTWRIPRLDSEAEGWLLIATIALLVHVHLVNTEWFYRYRAYLVVLSVTACAFGLSRVRSVFAIDQGSLRRPASRYVVGLLMVATIAGPLAFLAADALSLGPRGSVSIYLQQYQVARFLASQGNGPVALNDIGAVSYYTRRPVVDLAGLADQDVARARRRLAFHTGQIQALVRQRSAEVAVIYEEWFEGPLSPPASWVRVARWTAAEHVSVAKPTVSFFATRHEAVETLQRALEAWQVQLPRGVVVRMDDVSAVGSSQ